MKYIAIPVLVYIPEEDFGIDSPLQLYEDEIVQNLRQIPNARAFIAEDFRNGVGFEDDNGHLSAEITVVCQQFGKGMK